VVHIASTTEGPNLTAGTNFSLICIANGTANLRSASDLSYEWMYFNGANLEKVGTNSRKLHFSPLKLSDAGEYTCTMNISSSLLNSNLMINSILPYTILITGKLV
jgi:dihydroxyacetone kinase DhaKLM complex PTS-EIIA-like component DhaM